MEDPEKSATPRVKKEKLQKGRRPSDFYIMISKGIGKIRSFSLSSHILYMSALFFVVYIIASIFVFHGYFDKLREAEDQSQKIQRLTKQLESTRMALYRSKQRLVLYEGHGQQDKTSDESSPSPLGNAETTAHDSNLAGSFEPAEGSEPQSESQSVEAKVEIQDPAIQREEERLTVSFKIAKTDESEEPLRGYIHIIATDKEADPPQYWTYPKVELRDGLPIDYKRGLLFIIKHFRTIKGEYLLDSNTASPLLLKILVYNQTGQLMIQKEFEVNNMS
jgi:hypothetical protein